VHELSIFHGLSCLLICFDNAWAKHDHAKVYAEGRRPSDVLCGELYRCLDLLISEPQRPNYLRLDRDPWPINGNHCLFRSIGRSLSFSGCSFRDFDGRLGVLGLTLGGLPGELDLLLTRFPEFFGREPQQNGRDRQDDCESRSNGLSVLVNEFSYAVLPDAGRSQQIGDTFFKILGDVILAMLAYAALKRL